MEGPQEYAHPAMADWNGDGRLDLLVGDHWVEHGKRPELSAAQAQELDACAEELSLLSGRIGGARERVGDEVCRRMGLDWRELWKLDGATRTRYQEEFERGLREDQVHANARLAIDCVAERARVFEAPDREHGRVWVYLREAR
jgi:hypothetical protein